MDQFIGNAGFVNSPTAEDIRTYRNDATRNKDGAPRI